MFDPENILTDQCENALESVSFNKLRNKRAFQKVRRLLHSPLVVPR